MIWIPIHPRHTLMLDQIIQRAAFFHSVSPSFYFWKPLDILINADVFTWSGVGVGRAHWSWQPMSEGSRCRLVKRKLQCQRESRCWPPPLLFSDIGYIFSSDQQNWACQELGQALSSCTWFCLSLKQEGTLFGPWNMIVGLIQGLQSQFFLVFEHIPKLTIKRTPH